MLVRDPVSVPRQKPRTRQLELHGDGARIEDETLARLPEPDTVIDVFARQLASLVEAVHTEKEFARCQQERGRAIVYVAYVHVRRRSWRISKTVGAA